MKHKGIILSGGRGTRLYPSTSTVNKQLLPVYDKPMIYYPLSTLIKNGISDICIISSPEFIIFYADLFGNGRQLGINIEYRTQPEPKGLSEAFTIAEDFIGDGPATRILGDNIFHGSQKFKVSPLGATVFAYYVKNPSEYGVVEFDDDNKAISIEEKPENPKSKYAIPGYYYFDKNVVKRARELKPSERGELEITDLIKTYLEEGNLNVIKLRRGFAWLDAGTPTGLHQASCYIQSLQERQGTYIGCVEESAYEVGFLNKSKLQELAESYPDSDYKKYLLSII